MNKLNCGHIGNRFSEYKYVWLFVIACTLLISSSCQKEAQTYGVIVAAPPNTDTPVPPTPTRVPPTPVETPSISDPITISFMDPDTEKLISMMPQWVELHQPVEYAGQHPTVFIVGGRTATQYRSLAKSFSDRGYIAAILKWGTSTSRRDLSCTLAWLVDEGGEYGIDPDRIYGFGHRQGGYLLINYGLSVMDRELTQEQFADCPYTLTDSDALKGIASFEPALAMLEGGTLDNYPSSYADSFGKNVVELVRVAELLNEMSVDTWYGNQEFDEQTNEVLLHLPTYWIYARENSHYTPPLLLIDSDTDSEFDFAHEIATFTKHLDQRNMDYQKQHLTGITNGDLITKDGEMVKTIVDMADTFYREQMD